MANKAEVYRIIKELADAYPYANITEGTIATYVKHLSDLDARLLQVACDKLIATGGEFFPTVSKVRETVVSIALPEPRSGLVAWEEVRRNMILHGAEHPPGQGPDPVTGSTYHVWQFEDPITDKVMAGMGWREVCMGEKEAVDRAHFIHSYEEERDRAYAEIQVPETVRQVIAERRAESQNLFQRIIARLTNRGPRPERRDAASQTTAVDPGRALTRAPAGAVRQGEGEGAAEEGAREEGQGPRQVRPGARPHPGRARGQR